MGSAEDSISDNKTNDGGAGSLDTEDKFFFQKIKFC